MKEISGSWSLTLNAATVLEGTKLGDSIAVNDTCLTVTQMGTGQFTVGCSPEALRRTKARNTRLKGR